MSVTSSHQEIDSTYSAAMYLNLERIVASSATRLRHECEIGDATDKAIFHKQLVESWLAAHRIAEQLPAASSSSLSSSYADLLLAQLRLVIKQEVKLVADATRTVARDNQQVVSGVSQQLESARLERLRLLDEAEETATRLDRAVTQLTESVLDLVPSSATSPDPAESSTLRETQRLRSHCATLLAKLRLDSGQVRQATYSAEKLQRLRHVQSKLAAERASLLSEIERLRQLSLSYQAVESQPEYRRLLAAHTELAKSVQLLKYSLGYETANS